MEVHNLNGKEGIKIVHVLPKNVLSGTNRQDKHSKRAAGLKEPLFLPVSLRRPAGKRDRRGVVAAKHLYTLEHGYFSHFGVLHGTVQLRSVEPLARTKRQRHQKYGLLAPPFSIEKGQTQCGSQ